MKRVCFSLPFSFLLFAAALQAQNLIPNPSVEDYIECPNHLGGWPEDGYGLDSFVYPWQSLRGTPDYFNSCQTNEGLAWNNDLGYQEPRTGDGYLGAIMYFDNLSDSKEMFGVSLIEPLAPGDTYYCSFYSSMAYRQDIVTLACNRIGFLMMTENYLLPAQQDPSPNHSTYEIQDIISDTSNWVEISTSFVADSAYTMIAFGVFFDEDSVTAVSPFNDEDQDQAYYFFDDFCLTTNPNGCIFPTNVGDANEMEGFNIYPNPSKGNFTITSPEAISRIEIFDLAGIKVFEKATTQTSREILNPGLPGGLYVVNIFTGRTVITRRVFIQP